MKNFFLMTRGRTGSTAVMDELAKSSRICATQELFLLFDPRDNPQVDGIYTLIAPYDLWRDDSWWKRALISRRESWLANAYLSRAEKLAVHKSGATAFGFKVLANQFDERPFMCVLLGRRHYKAIYLTRSIARQVISGMVANQCGIFNTTEKTADTRRYTIDVGRFRELVEWEAGCVVSDHDFLKKNGFEFCTVAYEEFITDRSAFYGRIYDFLGVPFEMPPASDFVVMIRDLAHTIENYDEVAACAKSMGMCL
jgi:LPS sulfotransferase NodH